MRCDPTTVTATGAEPSAPGLGEEGLVEDLDTVYALALAGREVLPDLRRRASLLVGLRRVRDRLARGYAELRPELSAGVDAAVARLEAMESLIEIRPVVIDLVCSVRADVLGGRGSA